MRDRRTEVCAVWNRVAGIGMFAAMMVHAPVLFADAMDDDAKRAETLFNEARAAVTANDYATACPKFEASLKLARRAGTLFNLAQCEEHEGRLVAAMRYYKEGIVVLDPGDRRLGPSKKQLQIIEPRIPYLTIKLAKDLPKGGRVTVDGREAEKIGAEFPIDPGKHVVTVSAPKYADESMPIEMPEASRKEITVKIGPRIPDAPVTSVLGARRIAGIVTLGAGGLGLVAAAITGGLVVGANKRMQDGCPQTLCTTAEGYEAARLGKTLLVVNTIAWGVGIAGAAVGTILLVTSNKKGADKPKTEQSLVIGPGFVGIEGSF